MTGTIDLGRLASIIQDGTATQAEILADFRRLNAADGALLHHAVGQGAFRTAGLLAHRIKGASLMLGAVELAEASSLVAMACRAGDQPAAQAALHFFDDRVAGLDIVLDALGAIPAGAAATSPVLDKGFPMLCSDLTFIVVEDHEFQRGIIVRLLLRLGAKAVHGYGDSAMALQSMDDPAQAADIMVLDLSMPGMDGMDLMRLLSAKKHPISLILNSALSPTLMAQLVQMARNYKIKLLGAISKPMTEANLAPLVADYRASLPAA